jgi:hypothetical protein
VRQYGCPEGNTWESSREFAAAKARAIEDRHGELVIEEWLESCELEYEYEDSHWTDNVWFNGDCIVNPPVHGFEPIGCDMSNWSNG